MTEQIIRPNGKVYRPRKAPSAITLDDHDGMTAFVVVFRTHDIERATELAQPLLDEYLDYRGQITPDLVWLRERPDRDYMGGRVWADDPVRGIPCVQWEW